MTHINCKFCSVQLSDFGIFDLKALSAPWNMPPYSWETREYDQASLGGWPDAVMPSKQCSAPQDL